MSSGRTVAILLSPTRLEVALFSGAVVVGAEVIPLSRADWAAAWEQNLKPLDEALAGAVKRLAVPAGTRARLCYQSPAAAAEILALPVESRLASGAARLAMTDLVRFDVGSNPLDTCVIATESEPRGCHVLAIADRETDVRSAGEWLSRAGLRPWQMCPMRGAILWRAAREAIAVRREGVAVHLHLSNDATVILGTVDGRLLFARGVDFGFEMLAEAIGRAMSTEGNDLPNADPRKILFDQGVPSGSTDGLGRAVMPFMQPVLQRYLVETKQTLRFGLPSNLAAPSELLLQGPGAGIPGFDRVFAEQLQMEVALHPADAKHNPAGACAERGELHQFAVQKGMGLGLLPREMRDHRVYRAVQRALMAGAAAAAMLIGADHFLAVSQKRSLERSATELRARIAERSAAEQLAMSAALVDARVAKARDSLIEAVALHARSAGVLTELSQAQSEDVRLMNVRIAAGGTGPTAQLEAVAFLDGMDRTGDPIRVYMDQLGESPLVESVTLGSARLARIEGRPVKRFTLTIGLVPMPVQELALKEVTP